MKPNAFSTKLEILTIVAMKFVVTNKNKTKQKNVQNLNKKRHIFLISDHEKEKKKKIGILLSINNLNKDKFEENMKSE